jgi:hypothetical protein
LTSAAAESSTSFDFVGEGVNEKLLQERRHMTIRAEKLKFPLASKRRQPATSKANRL